jgi:hypothetical protein
MLRAAGPHLRRCPATIGGVLRNPLVLVAAALVLGGAVAYALRRLRGNRACAVSNTRCRAGGDTADRP